MTTKTIRDANGNEVRAGDYLQSFHGSVPIKVLEVADRYGTRQIRTDMVLDKNDPWLSSHSFARSSWRKIADPVTPNTGDTP